MSSQLYIGNGQATPSIVVEKQVPMPLSMQYRKDANGKILKPNTFMDLDGATDIGDGAFANIYSGLSTIVGTIDLSSVERISGSKACYEMFSSCYGITGIDFSSLETISGNSACYNMFNYCANLTSVDLGNLTSVTGGSACYQMFNSCTGITGAVNLSNLTTIMDNGFQDTFHGCTGITSVNLSSLETVGFYGLAGTFHSCTGLTNVEFPALENLQNSYELFYAFYNCTNLQSLSFPALKSTSFYSGYTHFTTSMLGGVTGCVVHFPSNLESVIGNWEDVQAGFGGTDTQVLFDLPATE